jgi:hypothetical protein
MKMAWPLTIGLIGCTETSVTTNQRRVTPQKSEDLIYTAAEAWNHADTKQFVASLPPSLPSLQKGVPKRKRHKVH